MFRKIPLFKRLKENTGSESPQVLPAKFRQKDESGERVFDLNLTGWRGPLQVNKRTIVVRILCDDVSVRMHVSREAWNHTIKRINKRTRSGKRVEFGALSLKASVDDAPYRSAELFDVPIAFFTDHYRHENQATHKAA